MNFYVPLDFSAVFCYSSIIQKYFYPGSRALGIFKPICNISSKLFLSYFRKSPENIPIKLIVKFSDSVEEKFTVKNVKDRNETV